jgi:hypothetical protein
MAQVLTVSLDFSQLMELAKKAHSAFSRGKNGRAYLSLSIWVNDTPDTYGNDVKATLNSTKAKKDSEGLTYVGNGRTPAMKTNSKVATGSGDRDSVDDDLPF